MDGAKCLGMILSALGLFLAAGTGMAAERTFTNSIGMEFVLIPAGEFLMGAADGEEEAVCVGFGEGCRKGVRNTEQPQHRVVISRPFYLGKHEVTQKQWQAVMGDNPSRYKGDGDCPVEWVSWNDAQAFIAKLNAKEGHGRYRLPSEAEWEYAARAGTTTPYYFGDDTTEHYRYAWCTRVYSERTHPVGQKEPNAWGLYDMYGNVSEWVQDWYGRDYYGASPAHDPKGPSDGGGRNFKVLRGGSWFDPAETFCRSAMRDYVTPIHKATSLGFRLALEAE